MPIIINYNPSLKTYARENRKIETTSEKLFWHLVRNNKFNGLRFVRQKIIGEYIVDFICTDTGVVIEIDGLSHRDKAVYDNKRDNYMKNLGLEVIRIIDTDITDKTDFILNQLSKHPLLQKPMADRKCFFTPSPLPSPKERESLVVSPKERQNEHTEGDKK